MTHAPIFAANATDIWSPFVDVFIADRKTACDIIYAVFMSHEVWTYAKRACKSCNERVTFINIATLDMIMWITWQPKQRESYQLLPNVVKKRVGV